MKNSRSKSGRSAVKGSVRDASQRQLRAGELIRHALAEVLREEAVADPALAGVSITVTEVRMSPDLRHATAFVEPLGGDQAEAVAEGLNRAAKFLRGKLAPRVDMKYLPDLNFIHDRSFEAAAAVDALFSKPEVARDLDHPEADNFYGAARRR